ncbi:hypothetical protein DVH05_005308 [Phytophthora capsici]|nr:hypothetical protein DVH05_005308 [Phytophthora capsici]
MLQEPGEDVREPSQYSTETGRCCGECLQLKGEFCGICRSDQEKVIAQEKNVDSFDFGSLGPPPPCPTLLRQKATDFTAAREQKRSGFFTQTPSLSRVNRRLPTPTEHCPLMM